MKNDYQLPCFQELTTCLYPDPVESTLFLLISARNILVLFFHVLPDCTKTLYTFSTVCVLPPIYLIVLDDVSLIFTHQLK